MMPTNHRYNQTIDKIRLIKKEEMKDFKIPLKRLQMKFLENYPMKINWDLLD